MTDPDPLEEALEEREGCLNGPRFPEMRAFAAIRVLKRAHYYAGEGFCCCGLSRPCPVLAEAAKALRGEP